MKILAFITFVLMLIVLYSFIKDIVGAIKRKDDGIEVKVLGKLILAAVLFFIGMIFIGISVDDRPDNTTKETQEQKEEIDFRKIASKEVGKNDILDIQILEEDANTKLVYELKSGGGFTPNSTREGLHLKSTHIMKDLKEAGYDGTVEIIWNTPFVDKYGNTNDRLAMKLIFLPETIERTNFDKIAYSDIPIIVDDYKAHHSIRSEDNQ